MPKVKKKNQYEQTKQALETHSDMTPIINIELSDRTFKITMINEIRVLMKKVDDIKEQM